MTNRLLWSGIATIALALCANGCDGPKSCEQLCALADSCPDVMPVSKSCQVRCQEQATIVEAGQCQQQQEDYDTCVSGLKNACDASNACSTEAIARNVCVNNYCTANPKVAGCTAP